MAGEFIFGLLYATPDAPQLAPVYDVLTTQVWIPGDAPAMRICREDREDRAWLDQSEQAMRDLARVSGIDGIHEDDIADMRAEHLDTALDCMGRILDQCPPGAPSKALELAIAIIKGPRKMRERMALRQPSQRGG